MAFEVRDTGEKERLERELCSNLSYFEDKAYHLCSFKEVQDLAIAVRDCMIGWLARSSVESPLEQDRIVEESPSDMGMTIASNIIKKEQELADDYLDAIKNRDPREYRSLIEGSWDDEV